MTLVFSTEGQRFLRIGLAVPLFGSISTLRAMVAEEGKISPDQVRSLSVIFADGLSYLLVFLNYNVCNTHLLH